MSMTPEKATALRKPFPPESVGKLPKPTSKENKKGKCNECGGWHGLPAVHLDYVGHAAVTDRLLTVDPEWTWRPFTGEEIAALPPGMREAGLWIMLTICGVSKPGFGDADGKRGGNAVKEMIGDAIRNAAMRFGVSLDLWAKENLVEFAQAVQARETPPPAQPPADDPGEQITDAQVKKLNILLREHGMDTDEARFGWLSQGCQREVTSSKQLTKAEATRAIDALSRKADS